jgi:hypothetical protein
VDPDPGKWVRVVGLEPENEGPGQADQPDQAHGRGHTDAGDRVDIRDDLGDPPLVQAPRSQFRSGGGMLGPLKLQAERLDQAEQGRGLMPSFMEK